MASQTALLFASIFPQSTATHTTPTPQATPDLGFTGPGQSFGGPVSNATRQPRGNENGPSNDDLSAAQRAVKRNIAWSTATQFLSLQGATIPAGQARHGVVRRSADVQDALRWLLLDDYEESGDQSSGRDKLLDWYEEEVKQHFEAVLKKVLNEPASIVRVLKRSSRKYR